ncbi:protein kinase [Streptomyces sp. NPDC046374]|uniref:serine/threonine protein kinase n=1 Tax=Streptomyces sp. NPDC046374 TaxID=3154917 RepID=UPI0033C71964
MTTVPPTEWDPEGFTGRADSRPTETRSPRDGLPVPLGGRFDLTEVLSEAASPTQAVVLRVKDREARHDDAALPLVLKWYHRAYAPDAEASRVLTGELGHVARVLERGTAAGHPYELMPSYGETTLAHYRDRHPGPLRPELVHAVVAQLHEALTALHDEELVHRDVAPDNIVLSTQNEDRLDLVLIDHGAAVHLGRDEDSPRLRDWLGKPHYLAPEAAIHQQSVTPAVDWWSLGMVAAELAGGQHPIDYLSKEETLREIATHDPDLSRVTDARLRMLCEGLLTRAPEHRWGTEQVDRWLSGGSPPVAPRTVGGHAPPPPAVEPFAFQGRDFTSTELLARQFDTQWQTAGRLLSRRRGRERLAAWLGQFTDAPGRTDEDAAELAELRERLTTPLDPPAMLSLLNWMGPERLASWHGAELDPYHLAELTRAAEDGDHPARELVIALTRHELLPLLAARPGGEGLDAVQSRWQSHRAGWDAAVADLLVRGGPAARGEATRRLRHTVELDARLLRLAQEPERTRNHLLAAGTWNAADGTEPPWYRALRADEDNPLRLLAAALLLGVARNEAAEQRATEWEREWERQLARETGARFEVLRRLDRQPTLGWALLGATLVTAPWTFLIGLADLIDRADQRQVVLAWMLALPAATVVYALELWIALALGALVYHPARSLAGLLIPAAERPFGAARSRGRIGIAVAAACLAALGALGVWAVVMAPWAWPAATVLGLAGWTVHRWLAWRRIAREARLDPAARPTVRNRWGPTPPRHTDRNRSGPTPPRPVAPRGPAPSRRNT